MKNILASIIAFITSLFFRPAALPTPVLQTTQKPEYQIMEVTHDLFVPWSLVFTSDSRMLVSERDGKIREIKNGQLNSQALLTFPEVKTGGEDGLMGMTLDPNYKQNKYLYVCLTYQQSSKIADKVVRLTDQDTKISVDKIIVDNIPGANVHVGCRIKFGPDQKLYITTGDALNKSSAQDPKALSGKILRVNSDGNNLEVFSLGHRNPQGIAWNSQGTMWETEHGPSGFDGPGGGDEVNIITQNGNYGWPIVSHEKSQTGLISPKLVFTPAIAPAGAVFIGNDFYFATLRGESLYKVTADFKYQKLPQINFGRIRDLEVGPDGALYFTTSNRDGRGQVREGDDKIYKVTGL